MARIAHWDEVEEHRHEGEVIAGRYQDLGEAAGSVEVGVGRFRVDPGRQSTPAHVEGGEEEITYVVSGSGWSWQDGATYEVRAGDTLVHLREEETHTLVAGDEGLEVLAFGERAYPGATHLPRAGIVRIAGTWVEALGPPHPYEREAAAGRVELGDPQPRPGRIVALEGVRTRHVTHGATDLVEADLGRAAGSLRTGLRHLTIAPGREGFPPHCHSAEEELLVVLAGSGVVRLGDEEGAVRAGSVIARPAGSGVAHSFVAGDEGLVLLAYGQRDPRDTVWYPRSRKLSIRAFGLRVRIDESLDYWDGEPSPPLDGEPSHPPGEP